MTENIPPAPQPLGGWPQPGQGSYPSHGLNGPVPGNEPPYGPPQAYAPPGYGQQPYPPQQEPYPYPGQPYSHQPYSQPGWVAPRPPKTGVRTASGVLAIVLGTYLLLYAVVGDRRRQGPGMASLLFLLALACLTAGILVVTLRLNKGVQVFALACSVVAALFALIAPAVGYYGIVLPATLLPLARRWLHSLQHRPVPGAPSRLTPAPKATARH